MNIKCLVLLTTPYGVDEMRAQQVWGDYRLTEEDLHYLLQPLVNLKQLYIHRIHTPKFSAHWIDCIKLAEKCNRQLEDLEVVTENAYCFHASSLQSMATKYMCLKAASNSGIVARKR